VRRDVVAQEQNTTIGELMLRKSMRIRRCAELTSGELVADKKIVGDVLHFLGVHQNRASPPFSIQETGGSIRCFA